MIKNILAFLAGTIVALLILEGFLRVYNPFPFRLKGGKITLPLNRRMVIDNTKIPGMDKKIFHFRNSLGFYGPDKPANYKDALTIFTIGGSTTECYYISDDKSWPGLLAGKLAEKYYPVWVNNAGLDGHSTFGHLVLLKEFILKLKPKVLIFLVGCNDVGRNDSGLDKSYMTEEESFFKKLFKDSELAYTAVNIGRYIMSQKMLLEHDPIDLANSQIMQVPEKTRIAELNKYESGYLPAYRQRLAQIIKLCRENDISPVFVTQPSLLGKGRDDVTGADLEGYRINDKWNGKLYWDILNLYNQAAKTVADGEKVFCIDLAQKMPKSSKYYYDAHHFTNLGAQKTAEIVYNELVKYLDANYSQYKRK